MELTKEKKLMQTIINEAWENETFKQELVANPIGAIEKLTGERVVLPKGKTLVVSDQNNEETIFINIPAKPNLDDMELNAEQLEYVSGGGIWDAAQVFFSGGSRDEIINAYKE